MEPYVMDRYVSFVRQIEKHESALQHDVWSNMVAKIPKAEYKTLYFFLRSFPFHAFKRKLSYEIHIQHSTYARTRIYATDMAAESKVGLPIDFVIR